MFGIEEYRIGYVKMFGIEEYRTGYFANANKYKELGYYPVSIARYNPKGTNYMQWVRVAPNTEILKLYKDSEIDELEYEFQYRLQLQNIDILTDLEYLSNVVLKQGYKKVVFLCYETSDKFCHRHIFADYIGEKFNIEIKELSLDEEKE